MKLFNWAGHVSALWMLKEYYWRKRSTRRGGGGPFEQEFSGSIQRGGGE